MTMSAPSSIGRRYTGVANVESTAREIPASLAIADIASMSVIFSNGFDGVSTQSIFVSGRIAWRTVSGRAESTYVKPSPWLASTLLKCRDTPP